jgi:hypothetical protein
LETYYALALDKAGLNTVHMEGILNPLRGMAVVQLLPLIGHYNTRGDLPPDRIRAVKVIMVDLLCAVE